MPKNDFTLQNQFSEQQRKEVSSCDAEAVLDCLKFSAFARYGRVGDASGNRETAFERYSNQIAGSVS
jgi:hypothetical protein